MSQTVSTPISPPPFLDVPSLLESSRPVQRVNWLWYVLGIGLLMAVAGKMGTSDDPAAAEAAHGFTDVVILSAIVASAVSAVMTVRRYRQQQSTVDAIEELMLLRRWEPAGFLLNRFLSKPVKSPVVWAQALAHLAGLLHRHQRFGDAIAVQDFLIDNELLDDSSDYAVRVGRTMAMLREDHLVDADRAISDLRRRAGDQRSAGLALVEMFRDVKTGHPDEAIESFSKNLSMMQQQMGHRVADAHGLVARAYDLLGRENQARAAYERATLLAPFTELQRRYPELAKLAEKFTPVPAPKEAA